MNATAADNRKGPPILGILACVAGAVGAGAGGYANASLMPEYHRASEAHLQAIKKDKKTEEAAFQAWSDAKHAAEPFGFVVFGFGGLAVLLAIVGLVKKQTVPAIIGLLLGLAAVGAGVLIIPAM